MSLQCVPKNLGINNNKYPSIDIDFSRRFPLVWFRFNTTLNYIEIRGIESFFIMFCYVL